MTDSKPITQLRLPDGKIVEAYAVRLPDGRIVVRSKEELERAPAPVSPSTPSDPRR